MSATKTVTVKMAAELVAETESLASLDRKGFSEYILEAVREKNERQLARRIQFLAQKFASESETMSNEFDPALGDGLGETQAR